MWKMGMWKMSHSIEIAVFGTAAETTRQIDVRTVGRADDVDLGR